ncbi:hypothetical protein Hamer_G027945 [Homarus americanus]|uniref:Uncharacterized protein n=1 Tax=Homarus americanus TaxID=6706 RepID=A0A8J5MND3_HOMAM|nr:hypothetical protein Hamer_G024889 [Homarus americanus]KAG7157610.1 hypothetical protein Hamer_G027945 [Homarus americanus]
MSKVTKADKYEICPSPDDITCDRCTLQWRVVMKQCDDDSCNYIDDFFCTDAVRQPKDSEEVLPYYWWITLKSIWIKKS